MDVKWRKIEKKKDYAGPSRGARLVDGTGFIKWQLLVNSIVFISVRSFLYSPSIVIGSRVWTISPF